MKYKFPAKPLKCRQKNLALISNKNSKVEKHDSLLIAKQISQGLNVFSSYFGKDNTEESLPFKGFTNFETEKAGQLLKKKIYEINVKNKNCLKSNPFRCTNVNEASSSIKLPKNSLVISKTDQTTSNDFKSGNGILRKARLNIASNFKVQDGLFSPSESWLQLNGDEASKPVQNESKKKKEESISVASLLKSRQNIINKKIWNIDSIPRSFKPNASESRPKTESQSLKGPRIKHVCRSASVVLKLPAATINDHQDQLSSTSHKTPEGSSKKSSVASKESSEGTETPDAEDSSSKEDLLEESTDPISCAKSLPYESSQGVDKPIARKLQDLWEDPELVPKDQLISIDYWQNYDPDEVCETGFALIGSQPDFPLAICFLCGSGGFDQCQLLHCLICCEPYHEYCLHSILGPSPAATSSVKDWLCPSCVRCEVCSQYGTGLSQISCRQCLSCYHAECLSAEIQHQMIHCIKCKRLIHTECNKKLVTKGKQYDPESRICQPCHNEEDIGRAATTPNLQTDHDKEIKLNSLNILNSLKTNKKLFELLKWNTDTSASELKKIKRKKLSSVVKSKSLSGSDPDLNMYQDKPPDLILDVKASRFPSKRGVSLDSSNELEFKENNSLCNNMFNAKQDFDLKFTPTIEDSYRTSKNLISIREKIDNYEYRSFLDLHNDILNVLYSIDCVDLLELYSDIVQEILSWLDNNVHSETDMLLKQELFNETNLIFDAIKQRNKLKKNGDKTHWLLNQVYTTSEEIKKTRECDAKNQSSKYILSKTNEEDKRPCVLCKKQGEGIDSLEGRLLYCGQNEWVHCNCALWSSEVFEEVDGSLQNIHSAIKRSKFIQCSYCTKRGATVGCCSKNCFNTYHLVCAKKSKCVFLESKMIYCNNHAEEFGKASCELENNLFVNRPIYVEQNNKRRKHLPADNIKFMIGALKIHSLGKNILNLCDEEDLTIPEDFHCSRLFWSTREPCKMVEYDIKTKTDYFLMDNEDQGVNVTISHEVPSEKCEPTPDHSETVKEMLTVMLDQICTKEETDDNQLLTPEVKDAIFKDLHHEFIDGLFMNDFLLRYDDILNDPVEDNAAILHVKIQEDNRRDKNWTKKFTNPGVELLQVDGMNDSDEDEIENYEQPVTCVRCHRTYRTTSSYENHLSECTVVEYLLSSDSEGDEESHEILNEETNYSASSQTLTMGVDHIVQPQYLDTIGTQGTAHLSLINNLTNSSLPSSIPAVVVNNVKQEQWIVQAPQTQVTPQFGTSIQQISSVDSNYQVFDGSQMVLNNHVLHNNQLLNSNQMLSNNHIIDNQVLSNNQTFIMNSDTENSYFNVDLDINGKGRPPFTFQQQTNTPGSTLMIQQSQVSQVPQISYIQSAQPQYIAIAPSTYTIQPTVVMQPNVIPQYITYQPTYSMMNTPQTYIVVNNVPAMQNVSQSQQIMINNESKIATKQVRTIQKTQTKHYYKKTLYNSNQVDCVKVVKSTTQKTTIKTEEASAPMSFTEELPSPQVQPRAKPNPPTQSIQHNPSVYIDYPRSSSIRSNSIQTPDKPTCIRVDSALQNRLLYSKSPKKKFIQYKKLKILPKGVQRATNSQSNVKASDGNVNSSKFKINDENLGCDNSLATSISRIHSVDINSKPKINQDCDIKLDSKLPDFPPLPKINDLVTTLHASHPPSTNQALNSISDKTKLNKKSKKSTTLLFSEEKIKVYPPPNKKLKSSSTALQNKSSDVKNNLLPKVYKVYTNKSEKKNIRNENKSYNVSNEQFNTLGSNCSNATGQFNSTPNIYSAENTSLNMPSLTYVPSVDSKQHSPVSLKFSNYNDTLSKQNSFENYKENIVLNNSNSQINDPYSFSIEPSDPSKLNVDKAKEYDFDSNISNRKLDQQQHKEEKSIKEIHFNCASYLEEFEKQIKQDLESFNHLDAGVDDETEKLKETQVVESQPIHNDSYDQPSQCHNEDPLYIDVLEKESPMKIKASPVRTQSSPTIRTQTSPTIRTQSSPMKIESPEKVIESPPMKLIGSPRNMPDLCSPKKIDRRCEENQSNISKSNLDSEEKENITWNSQEPTPLSPSKSTTQKIVFEIRSSDGSFTCQSSDLDDAWKKVFEAVQASRLEQHLPPLPQSTLKKLKSLGKENKTVKHILGQIPGGHFMNYDESSQKELPPIQSCARTEIWKCTRRKYDMFAWLCSPHRKPPRLLHAAPDSNELYANRRSSANLPTTMRYRNLCSLAKRTLTVFRSDIHGRGLFCLCDVDGGEMVIEYTGQVIRASVSDKREKEYMAKGIGCYMFKIDDRFVIDATMTGNAARFINHSCDPNCYSKVVEILGKPHIIIFALRKINKGEELTYDYKFPIEDDNKISCHCLAMKCRRYLN
uniref:Histone-lysine N-methyltransferase trithorax n=1 Tax=Cacopsylla melanoneura TaxID=428564 RepID=A0A8D9AWF3_9HEMI